jgi:hypothetical protein
LGLGLHPLVILFGDSAQDLSGDGENLAALAKEPNHSLGLQKRLHHGVEEHTVEAGVPKSDAMLVVFVKGVHVFSFEGLESIEGIAWTPSVHHRHGVSGISRAQPLASLPLP